MRLRRSLPSLTLLFAAACGHGSPPAPGPAAGAAPGWEYAGHARVTEGSRAMVVSGSGIASDVGRDILRQGGTAVDARPSRSYLPSSTWQRLRRCLRPAGSPTVAVSPPRWPSARRVR